MGLTSKKVEQKVVEGWVGKQKGMKQVSFERELVDLEFANLYSQDGPKDNDRKIIDESLPLKKFSHLLQILLRRKLSSRNQQEI
eukprot:15270817-Ditylum_brightwellii.AAC.1